MPRTKRRSKAKRQDPLITQLEKDNESHLRKEVRGKNVRTQIKENTQSRKNDNSTVTDKMARKTLDLAREQRDEESRQKRTDILKKNVSAKIESDSENEFSEGEYDGGNEDEELELDPQDESILELWMKPQESKKKTLNDIILEKIREHEASLLASEDPINDFFKNKIDPKVVEVYKNVGRVLKKYRAGRLPKAFKVLPALTNWEEILYLTQPEHWSPAATRAATKIFVSNLNSKMAQRFCNIVLLQKIRDDITEHKKLNFHLYLAMKKSVFKPSAFFKAIILPLCEEGNCTLREAGIIASVISKVSIPALHSAVALLKIAQMEYSGANSLFIRVLLDKKYALPYRVIDGLVDHFVRFKTEERKLPVLWHQALLVFIQRYKSDLTHEQKDAIKDLVRKQRHHQISLEIHRELEHSACRGESVEVVMKDQ